MAAYKSCCLPLRNPGRSKINKTLAPGFTGGAGKLRKHDVTADVHIRCDAVFLKQTVRFFTDKNKCSKRS